MFSQILQKLQLAFIAAYMKSKICMLSNAAVWVPLLALHRVQQLKESVHLLNNLPSESWQGASVRH